MVPTLNSWHKYSHGSSPPSLTPSFCPIRLSTSSSTALRYSWYRAFCALPSTPHCLNAQDIARNNLRYSKIGERPWYVYLLTACCIKNWCRRERGWGLLTCGRCSVCPLWVGLPSRWRVSLNRIRTIAILRRPQCRAMHIRPNSVSGDWRGSYVKPGNSCSSKKSATNP